MSDVTLSAAVRNSLLSLQSTTSLIERTNDRLSSGLKVGSAIDDPVAFFQAKTLNDRAFDFTEKKDAIDQGISSLSSALEGVESIEALVRQLKGVASATKSAEGTQLTDLISQFNDLRNQIGYLSDDTTYQGVNLVNNTSEQLTISFSDESASQLSVDAVNIRQSGLEIGEATTASASSFNYSSQGAANVEHAGTLTLTYQGSAQTFSGTGAGGTVDLKFGTVAVTVGIAGTQDNVTLNAGDEITVTFGTATSAAGGAATGFAAALSVTEATAGSGVDIYGGDKAYIREGDATSGDAVIKRLDDALSTLRTNAQTLGSNVALLNTRLEFTQEYVNALEGGAGKLTLADINQEGANLLALQTRQQLGTQALSFSGQSDQGVLSLFR